MTKKKTASSPSAAQCATERSRPRLPGPKWKPLTSSYEPPKVFAQTSAATAATSSSTPPTVSVRSASAT